MLVELIDNWLDDTTVGLLNGRLMNWCWKRVRTPLRDGF
jgi:hypothetical protein